MAADAFNGATSTTTIVSENRILFIGEVSGFF
jgi:hypothetical protein